MITWLKQWNEQDPQELAERRAAQGFQRWWKIVEEDHDFDDDGTEDHDEQEVVDVDDAGTQDDAEKEDYFKNLSSFSVSWVSALLLTLKSSQFSWWVIRL